MSQISIFDENKRLNDLSKIGDPLEKFASRIDWECFEPILDRVMKKEAKGAGGRPPYDYVMMFKILVLQRLYNISDDQTEYQIKDRLSFMRFLRLGLNDRVPDAKTIWHFREMLAKAGVMKELFSLYAKELEDAGLITKSGSIVDATFVEAPRQRNGRGDNETIKDGGVPEDWQKPENAKKLRQKDVDARWTKKNDENHYGYKDHVKADKDSKLIISYAVTHAAVHDSKELIGLLDTEDKVVYADSAYTGSDLHAQIPDRIQKEICEKGYRGRPLTEEQKESNRRKSKVRVRVEHVFGYMTNTMKGITVRSIGMTRAEFNIGMTNLVYNMGRHIFLQSKPVIMG